jgi:hypothetical protein
MQVTRLGCLDAVNSLALKHYLLKAEDIRKCPTTGCKYSGFIAVEDLANCSKPL